LIGERYLETIKGSFFGKKINILDLGCGSPFPFERIDIISYINSYIGVDIKSAKEVYGIMAPDTDDLSLMYKIYCEKGFPQYISKTEFNKKFDFHFNINIIDLFSNRILKNKFDVIILSNILHFIPIDKSIEILNNCLKILNNKNLIYISVAMVGSSCPPEKPNYLFTNEQILKLKSNIEVLSEEKNEIGYYKLTGKRK
jgi:hypothetical protein